MECNDDNMNNRELGRSVILTESNLSTLLQNINCHYWFNFIFIISTTAFNDVCL